MPVRSAVRVVRFAILAALLATAAPSTAQTRAEGSAPAPSPDRTFALSAQIGRSFSGTLTSANGQEIDWDVDPGLVVLARADFHVVQRFTMGLFVQLLRTELPERREDMGVNGYGLSLIGRFGAPDRPHARLGLLVAYQTNDFEPDSLSGSRGLGLGPLAEFAYPLGPNASLLAHLSFISQAVGGNSDFDITFGPLWYLAIGAEFGQ